MKPKSLSNGKASSRPVSKRWRNRLKSSANDRPKPTKRSKSVSRRSRKP